MTTQDTPRADSPAPAGDFGLSITVTPAQGGALLAARTRRSDGTEGVSQCVIGGDITSDAGRRKIQRNAIAWVKQAFTAPKRTKKAAAPAGA